MTTYLADNGRPWRCPRDHTCASPGRAHDTPSGYRHGCRSGAARDANSRDTKARRLRRAQPRILDDTTGVVRRLQALAALGWSSADLAAELGVTRNAIGYLRGGYNRPTLTTYRRVAELYERLCMTRGGDERLARLAARKGWAPPLAWDDIDDPHERPKLGLRVAGKDRPDHTDAVLAHTRNGRSAGWIAEQLGIAARTVNRIRVREAQRARIEGREAS